MAFLLSDQNQGTRNDAPRGMRRSRPFSFIRTLTVCFGFTPNLLTLLPKGIPRQEIPGEEGARGLGLLHPYRRWGLSPRPENYSVCAYSARKTGTHFCEIRAGRPIWMT